MSEPNFALTTRLADQLANDLDRIPSHSALSNLGMVRGDAKEAAEQLIFAVPGDLHPREIVPC
jgi:hypothetical protein